MVDPGLLLRRSSRPGPLLPAPKRAARAKAAHARFRVHRNLPLSQSNLQQQEPLQKGRALARLLGCRASVCEAVLPLFVLHAGPSDERAAGQARLVASL